MAKAKPKGPIQPVHEDYADVPVINPSQRVQPVAVETYTPETDVIKTLKDGRQILVAPAGVPIPMAEARRVGLVKDQAASGPSETKGEAKDEKGDE